MLPWAHAAFGYLCYSLGSRLRGSPPTGTATLALGFGTQFPDLVDKTFTWTFAVLPSGRSLAHSLFTTAAVLAVVYVVASRRGRAREARAFAVGWLSHAAGDGLHAAVAGDWHELGYLFYPLLPPLEETQDYSFLTFFLQLEFSAWMAFGFVLTAVGLAVWWADGRPGLETLARATAPRR